MLGKYWFHAMRNETYVCERRPLFEMLTQVVNDQALRLDVRLLDVGTKH